MKRKSGNGGRSGGGEERKRGMKSGEKEAKEIKRKGTEEWEGGRNGTEEKKRKEEWEGKRRENGNEEIKGICVAAERKSVKRETWRNGEKR